MPKDEFDFEDPFELNGMAFMTHEDTTNDMAETFIEEFMRMGYGHKQILALFRNPQYLGPNMALEKRGEPFIRDLITEVFARWGKTVEWPATTPDPLPMNRSASSPDLRPPSPPFGMEERDGERRRPGSRAGGESDSSLTDPMGAPLPKLNL